MGLGLLPWERWLPPYVCGPLYFLGFLFVLAFHARFHWWFVALASLVGSYGAWGTWIWFRYGWNVFDLKSAR